MVALLWEVFLQFEHNVEMMTRLERAQYERRNAHNDLLMAIDRERLARADYLDEAIDRSVCEWIECFLHTLAMTNALRVSIVGTTKVFCTVASLAFQRFYLWLNL